MKSFNNIYFSLLVIVLLMFIFIYYVDDLPSFALYFIIGAGCALCFRFGKLLIVVAFFLYLIVAVIAQLTDAEWFYHDMPETITNDYILVNLLAAFIFVVPICCGTGISWFLKRYLKKSSSSNL